MRSFRRYVVFVVLSTGVPLVAFLLVLALTAVAGGAAVPSSFLFASVVASWSVLVKWAPFAILIGAPAFTFLAGATSMPRFVCGLAALAAAAGVMFACAGWAAQCANSYYVRRSILAGLNPADASTFRAVWTLDDDFADDQSPVALSRYCPHHFAYTENGQVKHVDVHEESVFQETGPIR